MSKPVNPNPIFPITIHLRDSETHTEWGLSKREMFAALAMQSIITKTELGEAKCDVAKRAVGYADALLEELGK